jgi:hypothetical protein
MQLMEDKTPEETATQQMIAWYSCQATTNAAKK